MKVLNSQYPYKYVPIAKLIKVQIIVHHDCQNICLRNCSGLLRCCQNHPERKEVHLAEILEELVVRLGLRLKQVNDM